MKLRRWQARALEAFKGGSGPDFMVEACPGAGKTAFSLAAITHYLSERGAGAKVVVVAPTRHLRDQWMAAAKSAGIQLAPLGSMAPEGHGACTTYAQVASTPHHFEAFCARFQVLAVFDEIHHAGDGASWGDALRQAFDLAHQRLALSGTPFRTDPTSPMPYVRYSDDEVTGVATSQPDFRYTYANALADGGVVRVVRFAAVTGTATWDEGDFSGVEEHALDALEPDYDLGTTPIRAAGADLATPRIMRAWRTVLSPEGDWIPAVLEQAHEHLTSLRNTIPDAGGLVLAGDQDHARAYAAILTRITGQKVPVAVSDDPNASSIISDFSNSKAPWIVAVRLVSEGVDIPRLHTLVFAAPVRTDMFFRQAVGRVVRLRAPGETATIYFPAAPPLMHLADTFEAERDHALTGNTSHMTAGDQENGDGSTDGDPREPGAQRTTRPWSPIASTAGHSILLTPTPSIRETLTDSEADLLGLPGLLTPEEEAHVLTAHFHQKQKPKKEKKPPAPREKWEGANILRMEVNNLLRQAERTFRKDRETIMERIRQDYPGPVEFHDATADELAWWRHWLNRHLNPQPRGTN